MQNEQTMEDHSMKDHSVKDHSMKDHSMKDHCFDLQHKVVKQNHDHQSHGMQDCHKQISTISPAQHTDCQKCSTLSCQPSIVWFDLEVLSYQIPEYSTDTHTSNIPYKLQYPAGYWQEILRPPKFNLIS